MTPQNTKALQKMADWAKAGIFNSDYNAIGYDDAAKQFAKGKGVFLYEGNWETAVVEAGLGKDVSIINMPPGPSGKHENERHAYGARGAAEAQEAQAEPAPVASGGHLRRELVRLVLDLLH